MLQVPPKKSPPSRPGALLQDFQQGLLDQRRGHVDIHRTQHVVQEHHVAGRQQAARQRHASLAVVESMDQRWEHGSLAIN